VTTMLWTAPDAPAANLVGIAENWTTCSPIMTGNFDLAEPGGPWCRGRPACLKSYTETGEGTADRVTTQDPKDSRLDDGTKTMTASPARRRTRPPLGLACTAQVPSTVCSIADA
jgi:hypothetical protein